MLKNNKVVSILFGIAVVVAIGIIAVFLIKDDNQQEPSKTANEDVVDIGGVKCVKKNNVESYLIMGIDAKGKVEKRIEYDGTGQCDVLLLLVIDRQADTYAVLNINRDTVTSVHQVSDQGMDLGYSDIQIALAHSTGDGLEQSCEFVTEAVSNLLMGQRIDGYVALNMDAVSILNNMAGGVTVTIKDDFSESDKSLKMGETIKLTDEQAMHFVRGRMTVADGTNLNRMNRLEQFGKGFQDNMMELCGKNESYGLESYHRLDEYMVSSIADNQASRILKALLKNKDLGNFQIDGESYTDEMGFNAFNINQESLEETVRQLFYKEAK